MIFGHEGQPGSGKSYEAVLYHLIPAIKAKRPVYVRLNGVAENLEKIATYCDVPLEEVQALVRVMGDQAIADWIVCDTNDDGSVVFPHMEVNALVIIDEVHEYWPTGRAELPKRVGNFFAKHRHISLDVVLISQDFKEVHRSVIRRMQKKNFYTKLDALGDKLEKSYSVRFYNATAPGKFEQMASERRAYIPAVWELYHGVQPGVEGNATYKGNTKTLWGANRKMIILYALGVVVGVVLLARFFTGGGKDPAVKPKEAKPAPAVVVEQRPVSDAPSPTKQITVPTTAIGPQITQEPVKPRLPPGQQYVLDLAATARTRYAGSFGDDLDIVEWRSTGGGQVMDRLTTKQLQALGWEVTRTAFGVILRSKDQEIIATAWPVDDIGVQSVRQTEYIKAAAGPPAGSASDQQPASAAGVSSRIGSGVISASSQVASYGDIKAAPPQRIYGSM